MADHMQTREHIELSEGRSSTPAFTLLELVVVVAVLAVLALCVYPALARTRPDTRALQCMNNHRQLSRAWRMYADDYNDKLVVIVNGTQGNNPRNWVQGWLTWDNRIDNTNAVLLTDPRYALIAPYCGKDARPFKCPADQFVSPIQRVMGWKQRVRSVVANIYVGGVGIETGPFDPAFVVATKWADLSNPKPAETWLLMDEHPDSINDPAMFPPGVSQWIDLPGNLHDGGAGVAYADGSAEINRWQGSALNFRVRFVTSIGTAVPNDPDIAWMRARTPRKPGAN
jgi:prepilin-type N-terminal cleavage/methylation domain-containing protein/prepilin-type processing-associated H-X9-DG protein